MLNNMDKTSLFCEYYRQWVDVYKKVQLEKPQWQSI